MVLLSVHSVRHLFLVLRFEHLLLLRLRLLTFHNASITELRIHIVVLTSFFLKVIQVKYFCLIMFQFVQVKYLWLLFDLAAGPDNLIETGPYK